MDLDYKTEDGHILTEEDQIALIIWLIKQGNDKEYILNYSESEKWRKMTDSCFSFIKIQIIDNINQK
jgi:hypothetical protein